MKRFSQALPVAALGFLLAGSAAVKAAQSEQTEHTSKSVPERQTSAQDATAATAAIGDGERSALTFTGYDLTVHLQPQEAKFSAVARVIVRNDSEAPLAEIALQISSLLHWDSVAQMRSSRTEKLAFNQHLLQTDADRTGQASEVVMHLNAPLKPQALAELTLLYSGSVRTSSGPTGALSSSGSDISASETTLFRGFGDFLWYPAASSQVFLGDGASFAQAAGRQMLRQSAASVRLRLSVEYTGEAPGTAFLCGREQQLVPNSDDANAPVAVNPGIATAEFETQKLGFRRMSLAVAGKAAQISGGQVAVASSDTAAPERIASLSAPILRVLSEWIGGSPTRMLNVIDRSGEPFAEGTLLTVPLADTDDAALTALLVPALVHSRFRSEQVWLDQGMADFLSLIWLERTEGRPAAVRALEEQSHALALAESLPHLAGSGGLLTSSEAIDYRTKASSVLWQLRNIVGDDALKQTLQRFGREGVPDSDPMRFEKLLEQVSGKNLRWFFDDWVYHDPGLPELSIVSAAPRELASNGSVRAGWLVAVEVRNDGGAVADVPVTVRSGDLTATEQLRINPHSAASTRILFQGTPEQVQVNDGTVPEMIASVHTQEVVLR